MADEGPKNSGPIEDIWVNQKPQGMSQEEADALEAQDIREEYNRLALELEKHHGIFSQLWDMGLPRLTWDIPTAAVAFNQEGRNVEFVFNPLFWKDLDEYSKCFIICHEALHVMLSHGLRTKDCKNPEMANKALDVVVNHMLVNRFGFDRRLVKTGIYPEGHEKAGKPIDLCWLDTVFPGMEQVVQKDKPFEYYYRILEENALTLPNGKMIIRKGGAKGTGQGQGGSDKGEGEPQAGQDGWEEITGNSFDDHNNLEDFNDDSAKEEIADTLDNHLDDDQKEDLDDRLNRSEEGHAAQQAEEADAEAQGDSDGDGDNNKPGGKKAGSIAGRLAYKYNLNKKVKKNRKWETVIKKWSRRYKDKDRQEEQWTRRARRYSQISPDLMLPTDAEVEDKSETRIKVRFYQDTSGSCYGFRDRFFTAARSLPKDRFDVELFCFDTRVHPASLEEGKIYGGGGTSFHILEDHVQQQLKRGEIKRHPEAIFVITDGYGDRVSCAEPTKWYWFLSDNYTHCIPDKCNIFMLRDYE